MFESLFLSLVGNTRKTSFHENDSRHDVANHRNLFVKHDKLPTA